MSSELGRSTDANHLEIGKYFGVHYMTVSRAVRQYEQNRRGEC